MHKTFWFLTAAFFVLSNASWGRGQAPQNPPSSSAQSSASAQTSSSNSSAPSSAPSPAAQTASSASQQDSLADAARKAREQKKAAPKTAKVFTNDNIPVAGGISSVGAAATETTPAPDQAAGAGPSNSAAPNGKTSDAEKQWRDKFAALRSKLAQDQAALDVMQRELNVDSLQYYGGDPQKAYQDQQSMQPMGAAYNKKREEIEAKQKEIEADQQAISDAEDELRKSGGDPGWAR